MSISPLALSGVSQYAADFQNILNRAVAIAAIPVQLLQNRDGDLLQQKALLGGLSSNVAGLAASLASLGDIAEHQAISASSSNSAIVTVTNAGAEIAPTYTINSITSIATAASERTLLGYADSAATPVSSTGTVRLTVGAQVHTFALTNNSLIGLRDKINGLGAGVTASILTTAGGNYLSVSSNASGATTLSLIDDPTGAATALLTNTNQGTNAVFKLNGIDITQATNTVNSVIPGVTLKVVSSTASAVTISLTTDRSKLSAALEDFTTKYNTLRSALTAQVGENAGLLTGNPLIARLQRTLREITAYRTSDGTVRSLADLGIAFDNTGKASFSAIAFIGFSNASIASAFDFAGSASTGLGGFSSDLTEYSDPVIGLIRRERDGIDRADARLQIQIETIAERITEMQTKLAQRLALADSLLAQLETQQKFLAASLQSLNLVLYGRSTG